MEIESEHLELLIVRMEDLEDPRRPQGRKHKLVDIVILAVLATIAGSDDWESMEEYGDAREEWLTSLKPEFLLGVLAANATRRSS